MRRTGLGALAGTAATIAVLGAGGVFAGEGSKGPGQPVKPGELKTLVAKRVEAPSAARLIAPAAKPNRKPGGKKRQPEIIYKETQQPQTLMPGPTGFRIGNCPKRSTAINGYYYVAGKHAGFGLENEGDSPIQGLRQWAFYLNSPAGASNVTFGLICLKNVKMR